MPAQQSFSAAAFATPEMADQMLTAALGMMLKAPDLNRMGYSLATIRTYSDVPGGSSVELDYRNAENRLFTLYLRRPSGPARIELLERAGTRICIWQDDVLGTVMLGEMSAGEMARLASLAYAGLTS
jgi:anti-sigma factor RsiW